ncbi:MAG: aminotransferase class III-fold pyridoxal phosphate-dependent enzyme, partial [Acidimicrobiia bacterium]|nr:aminotransferase class III-fold pyridoxal phosphate-dependent enzyme [Acidimicrobiia bacterium]
MGAIDATYRQRTARSAALAERASQVMPGGDTRTAAHHPPYSLTIDRGEGPFVWDVDGHRYVDLIGNFTSLVHGNAYPPIIEAARRQLGRGTQWPARNEAQVELAELLVDRVASVDQVRFTNSGTEATMLALYIARVLTGRRKVLMARHGYHGSLEEFEVGFFGHEGPETLLAPHGDAAAFEAALDEHGAEVAAVVLEPVMGSAGLVASPEGFLGRVAAAAQAAGALFVLDEVITLRLATGGAQAREGVTPDLTAMGKIIGGGFPVGAVGGRADLLAVLDPRQPRLFHSGTFNGNPVTCAAGAVSLGHLTSDRIGVMEAQGERLAAGLRQGAERAGLPFSCHHAGSLVQCFFSDVPPEATLVRTDGDLVQRFHLAALNHGLFFAGRGLLALSTVIDEALFDE